MELCGVEKCSCCGACISVCPKKCIKLSIDENGFEYPSINHDECIECGRCKSVCHAENDIEKNYPQKAYATWSLDEKDRKTSTSGGAASVFYQYVINNNGIGYGATYDNNLNVVIKGYKDKKIYEFKNSKYVHSDMSGAFKLIEIDLSDNKNVIIIALPCQIAALKIYLKKDYANLLTVDIICHGTPPQNYLNSYIKFIENKCEKKVSSIKFRNDNEFLFQCFEDEKSKPFFMKTKNADLYLLPFFEALTYYESCYDCKYACNERVSDITIGDFWGLGAEIAFDHEYTGAISLVLINTSKGKMFFEKVKDKLFVEERTVEEALKGNDQLNRPSTKNENRDSFLKLYKENNYETAIDSIYHSFIIKSEKDYNKQQKKQMLRNTVKRILRK